MRKVTSFFICLCVSALFVTKVDAETKIAVIGKTKNDSFYETAFNGCEEFAQNKDLKCIYDGALDFQDPRGQVKAIKNILDQNVDGILLSTTDSNVLVERILPLVQIRGIPVMTFDSDLLPYHSDHRLAYIGTNNFDFGVALGEYAKKLKKGDFTQICIQSGSSTTPNLNKRVEGVRFALSGNKSNKKLTGENGWVEHRRCPFYTLGKQERALKQLEFLLEEGPQTIYLAVAGFAQFSPNYIERILPYQDRIKSGELVIISADAEDVQLDALLENLSTVNIGQRPFEMGRYGAELLYDVIKNNRMPKKEINYLGFYYCTENEGVQCSLD